MEFEHVLVVGAGQMGSGIAQVVAASGRRVSLHDAAPGAVERGLEAMRTSLDEARGEGRDGSRRRAGAGRAGGRARRGRPDDRGGRRGRAVKEQIFRRADEVLPADAILASNTSSIPITSLAAATIASGPRDRHALLQPGAGAEARRGDPRPRDIRRDGGARSSSSPASSARRPPRRATSPASSRTGS